MINSIILVRSLTISILTLLVIVSCDRSVFGQVGPIPPPRQDTQSSTGVSLKSGAFGYQVQDLSIGGGFPEGLALERQYLSNMDMTFAGYSGFLTQGWSTNMTTGFSQSMIQFELNPPPPGTEPYLYSISVGGRSIGFLGGSTYPTGGFEGSYEAAHLGGETLIFTGQHGTGYFTFTDSDGTVIRFNPASAPGALRAASWLAPDGTQLIFTYDTDGLRSVFSNRGYALLFEFGNVPGTRAVVKACAVNLAQHYLMAISSCPIDAQTVTYSYAASMLGPAPLLSSATDRAGNTTSYHYVGANHLGCVKLPGQSTCQISNTYSVCQRNPELLFDPPGLRWHDKVLSQITAAGESITYSYADAPYCPAPPGWTLATMTKPQNAVTSLTLSPSGLPISVTDPLNRTTTTDYIGKLNDLNEAPTISGIEYPEGNREEYGYDSRGNVTQRRLISKSGPGPSNRTWSASYPQNCANPKTCNKPDYVTDAAGNRTDYTYGADHGGVLREEGPAVSGVSPVKRYGYAQKYAWIKNDTGGYDRAATPVWLLTEERTCRTSETTGDTCEAGSSDEVVTSYDYGEDSGPNNLWLRGKVVTADGRSLRTCYGYDQWGNRISETEPRAGLGSCS